jgi:hypothetical protein
MKPAALRNLLTKIYKKHNIKVIRWIRGLEAETQSTVPRSYFDFIEDLNKAQLEFIQIKNKLDRRST